MKRMRWFGVLLAVLCGLVPVMALAQDQVLKPAEADKLVPASVYYRGQSAPVQMRNAWGVKFADGYYLLAALVDTSGYSTGVAEKYQAYFIAEVPVKINGQALQAGIYGAGFVGDKFLITDVGGHDVLSVASSIDDAIKHPTPLQIEAEASGWKLYAGRKYVAVTR